MKPTREDLVLIAKFASDSVIPPTPEETILTETSSFPIFKREAFIASAVPATSVLIIRSVSYTHLTMPTKVSV